MSLKKVIPIDSGLFWRDSGIWISGYFRPEPGWGGISITKGAHIAHSDFYEKLFGEFSYVSQQPLQFIRSLHVKFFTRLKVSTIPSPARWEFQGCDNKGHRLSSRKRARCTRAVRWKINRKRFNLQKQCGVESIEVRKTNQFFVLVGDWNLFSDISLK